MKNISTNANNSGSAILGVIEFDYKSLQGARPVDAARAFTRAELRRRREEAAAPWESGIHDKH